MTLERLEECLRSAEFWTDVLPRYARRQQLKADFWAIASGLVGAATGVSVFSSLPDWIVAVAAFVTAALAVTPRIKNYAEMAGQGREIASAYGPLWGRLVDAVAEMKADRGTDEARRSLVDQFGTVKIKKDGLRYIPTRKP